MRELDLWVGAGFTPAQALRAATAGAAEALGVGGVRGHIAPEQIADMVVLASDPRESLAALRAPEGVVLRGRFLPRAELEERLEALRASQRAQLAALEAPLEVPLPKLPEGSLVLEARYETRAFGLRVSAEHVAVVREPDGATSYCTRLIAPGGPASAGTDVEFSQRFREDDLESFALAIRSPQFELTIHGLRVGDLLQVERRKNGVFLDNQRAHKRLELVDIGSALTDIVIAQYWKEGSHDTLYFDGPNPVESAWRLEIAADDRRFLVATGQGALVTGFGPEGAPLFSFRRAGNAHTELVRLDLRTFGGPGLPLANERVFVHPESAGDEGADGGGK